MRNCSLKPFPLQQFLFFARSGASQRPGPLQLVAPFWRVSNVPSQFSKIFFWKLSWNSVLMANFAFRVSYSWAVLPFPTGVRGVLCRSECGDRARRLLWTADGELLGAGRLALGGHRAGVTMLHGDIGSQNFLFVGQTVFIVHHIQAPFERRIGYFFDGFLKMRPKLLIVWH